jgi:hypothetical protein
MKRFELLLPLTYNDGADVEGEKFDQTSNELCDRFGGTTQDTVRVAGIWKYAGVRYRDELVRIRIETVDPDAREFFLAYKEVLKERFQQIDIWIVAHDIEII